MNQPLEFQTSKKLVFKCLGYSNGRYSDLTVFRSQLYFVIIPISLKSCKPCFRFRDCLSSLVQLHQRSSSAQLQGDVDKVRILEVTEELKKQLGEHALMTSREMAGVK